MQRIFYSMSQVPTTKRLGLPCLMALSLALVCSCDRPGCDGLDYVHKPGAPVITRTAIAGTYPGDPWTLILGIEFTGGTPALSSGSALFYIGGDTTPTKLPLTQAFAQSGLPLDATSGRLGVLFPFNSGTVQDGDRIRLGVQLESGDQPDPKGLRSNCYNLDLGFDVLPYVPPKSASLLQRLRTWAGGALGRPSVPPATHEQADTRVGATAPVSVASAHAAAPVSVASAHSAAPVSMASAHGAVPVSVASAHAAPSPQ